MEGFSESLASWMTTLLSMGKAWLARRTLSPSRAALASSALASPFLGALELRGKRIRRCW